LQLLKPAAHVPEHKLLVQVGVTLLVEQAKPQAPQFETVLVMFVSQPSVRLLLLQSPKLEAQLPVQLPPLQTGFGTLLFEHGDPQDPQLAMSCEVSATLVAPCPVVCPAVTLTPLDVDEPAVPGALY
jgi:hypothetical protein